MGRFSRRELLQTTLAGVGAHLAGSPWSTAAALPFPSDRNGQPHISFPAVARERLAVATWPFRAFLESAANEYRDKKQPGIDLKDFAARVRTEFHVPGVEPLSTHFPSTEPAYLHGFRNAIEQAGVHVVNIPVDNSSSFYDGDPQVRRQAIEHSKKWIDVAVVIGSPSVRTSIAAAQNAKPDPSVAAAALQELADYGAAKNVVVNLENDDVISEDAFFIATVIEKVNHPYLHALPDFCNSMATGDEQRNYAAVARLFPLAYNICHVKDSEVGENGNLFGVDLRKTFGILKAAGYRGYCSMEFEGRGSPFDGTRFLIQASLENLT